MKVPVEILDEEKVVRGVYHQMNFDRRTGELRDNVLRSPANHDEISTIRLDYCNIEFCRDHFKRHERPDGNHRKYWGFFLLFVNEVRMVRSEVVSTQDQFEEHADIKHGYIELPHIEPPVEIRIKINKLLTIAKTRLKQDSNPLIEWSQSLI